MDSGTGGDGGELERLRRENADLRERLSRLRSAAPEIEEPEATQERSRRPERMTALAEAAPAIFGAPGLAATLQAITDAARSIVGTHQAVCSLTRGPDRSQAINAVGLSDKYARWRDFAAVPDGSGIYAWVCEGNRTVRMTQEELEAHPRWRGFGPHAKDHPPLRGWLATALVGSDGRNLGLVQLSDKVDGGEFDEVDEAVVVQLAQFAASAIERVQAEAHVRASEEQLRLLADALPLLVSLLGPDERYRFMNKAHEDWFSQPRSELLGRTIREVLGEEAYALRRPWIEAVLRGEAVRFEGFTPGAEGVRRDTEIHYLPRREADGTLSGFYGVVVDMTEQKAAQRALQGAREEAEREAARTAAILGQLAEGVIVTDATGRITFVNEAARRIHGVARLDVAPGDYSRAYRLLTEDGRPYPPKELPLARAALRGETVEDARWRIRRPDGREVIAVGGARPIRTQGGLQVGAVLTLRDDTARASAEAQLRSLNRNLEAEVAQRTAERDRIWQNSSELMAVFGFDGDRRTVNPAWTRTLGYDEETLLSSSLTEITHPEDRERLGAAIARLRQGERIEAFEGRFRHADGSYRIVSWTAVPGEGVFYAIGRDVTEQRLAEEVLRQSQKMEAVGQLTGGIAHDFNNLLAGILGSLERLDLRLRQGRTEGLGRYIEAATASAQRAAALTHRLLAFARRQPLDPRPVEANALVGGMEELLRRSLGPSVALELDLAEGLWGTRCDPVQLESALLNLCINARDAMPEGGRLVVATANVGAGEGARVAISVSDSGSGMAPEVLARAFEPFFTTKPLGQGTGLGLSMVYGFARQSGGEVRIDSGPGRGTTVRIELPRHEAEAAPVPTQARPTALPRSRAGATVLLAEDEAVLRGLIAEALAEQGYRVLVAPDGPAALALLERPGRVDLLVTDIGLPGLDGRQVAARARRARPGLRVLFVTGYAGDAAPPAADPGTSLLTKPFALDALLLKVEQLTQGGPPG